MRGAHIAKEADYLESKVSGSCVNCGESIALAPVMYAQDDYLEGGCNDCGYHNSFHTNNMHGWKK